jgi:hypothetical protein
MTPHYTKYTYTLFTDIINHNNRNVTHNYSHSQDRNVVHVDCNVVHIDCNEGHVVT